jgi:hypothetical protein
MNTRGFLVFLGVCLLAALAALAGGSRAQGVAQKANVVAAGSQQVRIVTIGKINKAHTAGSGTFTASGGISDKGTFTGNKVSSNKTKWLFVGRRGTIKSDDDANGRWIITGGTKAYAGLTGKGSQSYPVFTPRFRMVWTGTVTGR